MHIVQSHPGINAERIADRLEVTDRAVRRYVAVLRGGRGDRIAARTRRRCVLVGTINHPVMYASEMLAVIPHPFRVIGGDELRATVRDLATRMSDAVADRESGSGRGLP